MLPRALSNGACSLNAGEKKYALSAIITLSSDGDILSLELLESVIVSRVRGVYSEVNALLSGEADADVEKKYSDVKDVLLCMVQLYEKLKAKSESRGAMDFDADEAEILLDKEGIPYEIVRRERGVAERIIEQFMITANEAVARELSRAKIPCVYRVHEAPPPDKFSEFVNYAHTLGIDRTLLRSENPTAKMLSAVLREADGKGILMPVSRTMLRTMAKAKYSAERASHFGLGLDTYCHFTSPIRRLSDLATHRIIKRVLFGGKPSAQYSSYARRAAAAATDGELRALSAERRIENLYKVVYMQDRVGEEFSATVCSAVSYGFFVELDNTVEGLVHTDDLPYGYIFDEKTLTHRSRTHSYKIGDRLRVRLAEVDIIRGKLSFVPVENI
jgi:ribonuclease R